MNIDTFTGGIFDTNCFFLSESGLLIDAPQESADWLASTGRKVRLLLLTHGHIDHVWEAARIQREHGCPVACHADTVPLITEKDFFKQYGYAWEIEPVRADHLLVETPAQSLGGVDFQILLIPGHCPGSLCFYQQAEKIVFGGDVLFAGGVGRTDLPGGDTELLFSGIREKLFRLDDDVTVLPGHGPATKIGVERRGKPLRGRGRPVGGGGKARLGNMRRSGGAAIVTAFEEDLSWLQVHFIPVLKHEPAEGVDFFGIRNLSFHDGSCFCLLIPVGEELAGLPLGAIAGQIHFRLLLGETLLVERQALLLLRGAGILLPDAAQLHEAVEIALLQRLHLKERQSRIGKLAALQLQIRRFPQHLLQRFAHGGKDRQLAGERGTSGRSAARKSGGWRFPAPPARRPHWRRRCVAGKRRAPPAARAGGV